VFHHAGIKIPYFAFFAHDRGYRVSEPPVSIRVAMALAAAICIGIGVAPGLFYELLPHEMDYAPYTTAHVINQLQLLLFAALAFTVLVRTGLYPPEIRSVNLDVDAVYRKSLPAAWAAFTRLAEGGRCTSLRLGRHVGRHWMSFARPLRPGGRIAMPWSTHVMVWWPALVLGLVLLLALL
jgi:multicomponent Na+:H+ antiporter subunit D